MLFIVGINKQKKMIAISQLEALLRPYVVGAFEDVIMTAEIASGRNSNSTIEVISVLSYLDNIAAMT
jgi:hypothetical protein